MNSAARRVRGLRAQAFAARSRIAGSGPLRGLTVLMTVRVSALSLLALSILAYPASGAGPSLLIEHITVIDGTGAPPQPDTSVLAEGGRISWICQCVIAAPANAEIIDGSGKFLIPGLMDTYIHLEGGRRGAVGTART